MPPASGDAAHQAVERIDLAHQMALAEAADRRVARHHADRRGGMRQQRRARAGARRCGRRLGAGMAAADHDAHRMPLIDHRFRSLLARRHSRNGAPASKRSLFHVKQGSTCRCRIRRRSRRAYPRHRAARRRARWHRRPARNCSAFSSELRSLPRPARSASRAMPTPIRCRSRVNSDGARGCPQCRSRVGDRQRSSIETSSRPVGTEIASRPGEVRPARRSAFVANAQAAGGPDRGSDTARTRRRRRARARDRRRRCAARPARHLRARPMIGGVAEARRIDQRSPAWPARSSCTSIRSRVVPASARRSPRRAAPAHSAGSTCRHSARADQHDVEARADALAPGEPRPARLSHLDRQHRRPGQPAPPTSAGDIAFIGEIEFGLEQRPAPRATGRATPRAAAPSAPPAGCMCLACAASRFRRRSGRRGLRLP